MIVVLGGGLTGLSTAYHLGDREHVVLEAAEEPGGICRSIHVDGYTFDYTGHLLHLRDPRAIELVDELMPDVFEVVSREAGIRSHGVTLPFPYQANLHGLPKEVVAKAIVDFARASAVEVPEDPRTSFRDWALAVFGEGISDGFMFPYNEKLFRRDPRDMTADWVSWAVPRPGLAEVVRGALGMPNRGMGYNPTFRYPRGGGIEVVPRAFASRVDSVRCGTRVTGVDLDARVVETDSGDRYDYERLVMTLPLPAFLRMARGGGRDWARLAEPLDWSIVACLNVGVARADVGDGNHWLYFPDRDVPFYRVGFPSNFSSAVAPDGCSSMYIEHGFRRGETIDAGAIGRAALDALRREGILGPKEGFAVSDLVVVDPGYVIFDRARQDVMAEVVPALEALGVHVAGRYGAWTYSYMERSMLDGLEVAARLA